jgi:hypothetical protein
LKDPKITMLVLDVVKNHIPSLPDFASFLVEFEDLMRVEITLVEIDERTDSLKVVLNGTAINYDAFKEYMEKEGAVIHSVDQVIVEK